ncbi:MAG: C4-type zinc ribbon domain-containing protein [Actinomycetota bacterium]|nr:C4-type zinc ribbon domain-containing protein [Actinomycetota bacterium]
MDEFKLLEKIQSIDSLFDELGERKANLPETERLELLRTDLANLKGILGEKENRLKEESLKQKKLEGELELLSAKIKNEEKKLYGGAIRDPKELLNLQEEVRALCKHKDELETDLLEQLDLVENLTGEVKDLSDQVESLRTEEGKAEKEHKEVLAEIETKLTELNREREGTISGISDQLLELYGKLRGKIGGVVVVGVEEGICQGCRTELPAEEVDKMIHSNKLWRCSHCRRIIVRWWGR